MPMHARGVVNRPPPQPTRTSSMPPSTTRPKASSTPDHTSSNSCTKPQCTGSCKPALGREVWFLQAPGSCVSGRKHWRCWPARAAGSSPRQQTRPRDASRGAAPAGGLILPATRGLQPRHGCICTQWPAAVPAHQEKSSVHSCAVMVPRAKISSCRASGWTSTTTKGSCRGAGCCLCLCLCEDRGVVWCGGVWVGG